MTLGDDRLTVCVVSFGHARHLALNWELCQRLLGIASSRVDWLVAENAQGDAAERLDPSASPFKIVPGSSVTHLGGSYHHADAVNMLLSRAATRFVLVLDPDFYLLRRNWMDEVLAHMRENGLALFGVPWHPRYVENYRYFPAVHCMFIDQEKVPAADLDFRPLLQDSDGAGGSDSVPRPRRNANTLWHKAGLGHRLRQPWDTGARIYLRYRDDPRVPSEFVTPVYRLPDDWIASGNRHGLSSRVLERILPDDLCYLPKRHDSYTTRGFRERGWIDVDLPRLWEEHVWKDAPFGLHLRRSFSAVNRDTAAELELCGRVIEMITRP